MREVELRCGGRGQFRGEGHGGGWRQRVEGERRRLEQVAAGRQAEAGAALHGHAPYAAAAHSLDAAAAVAPPLLHRRPHPRALRAPAGAEGAHVVGAGQRAALPLAGRRRRVRGGRVAQLQLLQQAADGAGGGATTTAAATVPVPVARAPLHLGQDVPQVLQTGSDWPGLQGAAVAAAVPQVRLCSRTRRRQSG